MCSFCQPRGSFPAAAAAAAAAWQWHLQGWNTHTAVGILGWCITAPLFSPHKKNKFQLPSLPSVTFILRVAAHRNCATAYSSIHISSGGSFSHCAILLLNSNP